MARMPKRPAAPKKTSAPRRPVRIVCISDTHEWHRELLWGSPVTCDEAAYGYTRRDERARLYASIPRNVHILITHGPPFGILDREPGSHLRQGCTELRLAVMKLQPRLHVFGHVHGGYGRFENESTLFVNAALLGLAGDLENLPVVLDISRR
jgi:hypothetical protein